ncbi:MAG: hypothetical protein J5I65_12120 [Aridibacter famidurans]|nr:hypothetical protein [Aridibacter famidurans]
MNEDYLWNRTGTDAGIEDLERKLAPFRLQAKEAPRAVPAAEPRSRPRFGFRLAFAGLSFASVLAAAFMFFAVGNGLQDPRPLSVRVESPPSKVSAVEIPDAPSMSSTEKAVRSETPARTFRSRALKAPLPETVPTIASDPAPPEDHLATLTKEEREAYDQLMLALSVTTSSLKLVQEKADGDTYAETEIPARSN